MNQQNEKTKILLVEDDPFLIDIYSTKLRSNGFEIDVAHDGEEALRKITERAPDLVLLDIVLPRVDGWEVLNRIKKQSQFKDLKIIILSNLGQEQEVRKGLELGVAGYLIKSHYSPSEIIAEIKKVLQK
ncbi:MAG: response regulator [bacterium]